MKIDITDAISRIRARREMKISHRKHGNHRKDIADAISEIREIRVRHKISVLSVRSNFRVSLFFSRYFAINIMTVYAMEWECENTRKSENHAKIDIAAAISL